MFPTHVGMNRPKHSRRRIRHNVPHACGDEPSQEALTQDYLTMFPTHVGMNRGGRAISLPCPDMFPTHVGMNR